MFSSLNPILLFVGLIALSAALVSIRRFLRREPGFSLLKLSIHLGIVIATIAAAWFPQSARAVTRYLGFGDNLNTLIFVAFMVQFLLIYKLMRTLDTLESRITKLAQKVSLGKSEHSVKKAE